MSEAETTLGGSGGLDFNARSFSNVIQLTGSGYTTLATITPPPGKRVRITMLSTTTNNFLGIEIRVGGVTVAGSENIYLAPLSASGTPIPGHWCIGNASNAPCNEMTFKPGAVVTIYNNQLQSINNLVLAYQIEA